MTRPLQLFTFVALAATLAGGMAVAQSDASTVAAQLSPGTGDVDTMAVQAPPAPRTTFDLGNTDYAAPRGVVDPPAGHAGLVAVSAETRGAH